MRKVRLSLGLAVNLGGMAASFHWLAGALLH